MPQTEHVGTAGVHPAGSVPGRLTLAHAFLLGLFPALGSVLYLVGHVPVLEILQLLGGCGLISAGVIVVVTGGRRIAESASVALATGLLRLVKQS
ncbi:hypothetical protein [Streptomyces sp. NBC_00162]|uniref:hypothetical protein n=1 Tax=Streptomyces sp. NBC_00162 TaxID=2903629 RepID=UPI00214B7375|nr:hypothetical protein [Streptomyces sp. NBC_00162]UUU44365.1 hypothetical protein JIW86_39915 [Streptomyces sp. NBC_00162]